MATPIILEDFETNVPPGFPGYPPENNNDPSLDFQFDVGFSLARLNGTNDTRQFSARIPTTGGPPRLTSAFLNSSGHPATGESTPVGAPPYSGNYSGRLNGVPGSNGQAEVFVNQVGVSSGMGMLFIPQHFGTFAYGPVVEVNWQDEDPDIARGGTLSAVMTTSTNLSVLTSWYDGDDYGSEKHNVTLPMISGSSGPWVELRYSLYDGYLIQIPATGQVLFSEPRLGAMPGDGMQWDLACYGSASGSGGALQIDHIYGYKGVERIPQIKFTGINRAFIHGRA